MVLLLLSVMLVGFVVVFDVARTVLPVAIMV